MMLNPNQNSVLFSSEKFSSKFSCHAFSSFMFSKLKFEAVSKLNPTVDIAETYPCTFPIFLAIVQYNTSAQEKFLKKIAYDFPQIVQK